MTFFMLVLCMHLCSYKSPTDIIDIHILFLFSSLLQQSALARYANSLDSKASSVNLDVPSLKGGVINPYSIGLNEILWFSCLRNGISSLLVQFQINLHGYVLLLIVASKEFSTYIIAFCVPNACSLKGPDVFPFLKCRLLT